MGIFRRKYPNGYAQRAAQQVTKRQIVKKAGNFVGHIMAFSMVTALGFIAGIKYDRINKPDADKIIELFEGPARPPVLKIGGFLDSNGRRVLADIDKHTLESPPGTR